MIGLVAIDIFAVVMVTVGFHIAFRQRFVRGLVGQRESEQRSPPEGEPDPLASVLRIAGVMLMAFGATICAFANLIAHFSAASSRGGI